jgi:hypothetical protein
MVGTHGDGDRHQDEEDDDHDHERSLVHLLEIIRGLLNGA